MTSFQSKLALVNSTANQRGGAIQNASSSMRHFKWISVSQSAFGFLLSINVKQMDLFAWNRRSSSDNLYLIYSYKTGLGNYL